MDASRPARGPSASGLRPLLGSFTCLRTGRADLATALRLSSVLAAALLSLGALGHQELSMFAMFGVLPVMFAQRVWPRAAGRGAEAHGAALIGAGVLLGSALAVAGPDPLEVVVWESIFCVGACAYAAAARVLPHGPFFALFAFGASASAPRPDGVAPALLAFCAPAVLAIAVGAVQRPVWRRAGGPAAGSNHFRMGRVVLSHLLVVPIAGALALATGVHHAYWAMASAAVPLSGAGLSGTVHRSLHRITGTLAGSLLAVPLLEGATAAPVLMAAAGALSLPTELYMRRNYALALAFFTPLIIAVTALANPSAGAQPLAYDRAVQGVLGALVGLGVGIATRIPLRGSRSQPQSVSGPEQ